jgi:two-component sensor histidine kinase
LLVTLGLRLILLILLAAVPVFLVQVTHELQLREYRRLRVLDNAQVRAGLTAARLDRAVEGARLLLAAASRLEAVRKRDGEACNRELQEIVQKTPELTAIAVLSAAGDRWCVSLTGTGPINLADRPYFQATVRSGRFQSSDYIVGRQTGRGSIAFTYPILGATGEVEDVIFLAYGTDTLSGMLEDPVLTEGEFVALLDQNGIVGAKWPEPGKWVGRNLSASDVVRSAIANRRGVLAASEDWAGAGEYAFAFAPMQPPTNLTVLVGVPLTAALHVSETLFWKELAWTTLVFILAALLAMVGAHFMVGKPLRELHASVDALARGDFQSRPAKLVHGSRELRSLAEHFETMARALETRQSQLLEALQQRELLLKEVNHRVKNSLQIVASLFGLQRAQIKDPEARRQFEQAGRRINTVARIHQRLYQDERVDIVSFDRFLQELCDELNSAMGDRERLTLVCEAPPCRLPTDKAIPLALMLNEIITNAFKYAYVDDAAGEIRVSCREADDALIVSVSDDGHPLPENFDPANSTGLGMRMITALAKQLRATLEVVRHSKGKSFVLNIPTRG